VIIRNLNFVRIFHAYYSIPPRHIAGHPAKGSSPFFFSGFRLKACICGTDVWRCEETVVPQIFL
jgi:hypothetical protein